MCWSRPTRGPRRWAARRWWPGPTRSQSRAAVGAATKEPWRPLTVREFEVARLIAEGMTNAEIAAELSVAPKTVSAHVEHILAKLGVARRTEVAAWAAGIRTAEPPQPAAIAASH